MNDNLEQRVLRLERQIAAEAAAHRDRRERIATAALAGMLATGNKGTANDFAFLAVNFADNLIAELDKEVKP